MPDASTAGLIATQRSTRPQLGLRYILDYVPGLETLDRNYYRAASSGAIIDHPQVW